MIIPSIDILGGRTVQLVGGETLAIDAGDPRPLARRFGRVGEVAAIDLDAARGTGSNRALIEALLPLAPLRVGGGIRDAALARSWLDAGAAKVILGTAARVEVLEQLPAERVIAAVDARDGEVVVEGWRKRTGRSLTSTLSELAPHVGGFLVTLVEREGQLVGVDLERARAIAAAAKGVPVTLAGGVASARHVGELDRLGIDAQVGMALYTGRVSLGEAVWACLASDRADGLVPTIVADDGGRALGLVYSSLESLHAMLEEGVGVYASRRRGLWRKGATSGATEEVVDVRPDCDRDALLVRVRQREPGFCHLERFTCFGAERGLARLERTLQRRKVAAPRGSYAARLFAEPALLADKLREEAAELAVAKGAEAVLAETADVVFFALARLVSEGGSLAQLESLLDQRSLRTTRRPGDAKTAEGVR
ncbi:MAG: phosphoribosyl-ATP diphosphatase [Planctomycetaceae bacterium]|nr:phosphoribosyl-ATP diphosphatase [Planctomycetaceae bacterium]